MVARVSRDDFPQKDPRSFFDARAFIFRNGVRDIYQKPGSESGVEEISGKFARETISFVLRFFSGRACLDPRERENGWGGKKNTGLPLLSPRELLLLP